MVSSSTARKRSAPQSLSEHRIGREAAPYPEVESSPPVRVDGPHEGEVVNLVLAALVGAARDRDLVLAGQVRELQVARELGVGLQKDFRCVDHLGSIHPRKGTSEDIPGSISACLGRGEADSLELAPYLGHVLDADPVELDVLAVGDIGEVAAESLRQAPDHRRLLARQLTSGDANAEHEVAVGLGPLGVEAVPAEAVAQVAGPDRAEALLGVAAFDPGPDVQAVVLALRLLGGVEGLPVAEGPLALGTLRPGGRRGAHR